MSRKNLSVLVFVSVLMLLVFNQAAASLLFTPGSVTFYLPFGPEAGEVRVNRTGLLYEPDYTAAGIPTSYGNCNNESYCYGYDGEYHDYQDEFGFTRGAIDFALPSGTRVLAAADGAVVGSETNSCQIAVQHADGTISFYLHLSSVLVSGGESVQQGQHIGYSGASCGATGPHLHFALWNGVQNEVRVSFADASVQLHGGIVRPSRTGFLEYRYTAESGNRNPSFSNPSFETGDALPWEWLGPCNRAIYQNGSIAHDGSYYLATNRNNDPNCISFFQDIDTAPDVGETYRFAFWVRSTDNTARQGRIAIWALGGEQESRATAFSVNNEWQCVETDLNVQNGGHSALRTEVYLDSLDTLDYYFDDASFAQNGGPLCSAPPPPMSGYVYEVDPPGYVCGPSIIVKAQFAPDDDEHNMEVRVKKCDNSNFGQAGQAFIAVDDGYVYEASPTGYVCGDIVELKLAPDDNDHNIEVRVKKCAGGAFSQGGRLYLDVLGSPHQWGPIYYSAGVSTITFDIDPMAEGITGSPTYVARVYSADQPDDPKYTGEVTAWADYDDYEWGPISYNAGVNMVTFDIDPVARGLLGNHTYRTVVFPTGQHYPIMAGTIEAQEEYLQCYTLTTTINPADGGQVSVATPPNCEGNQYEEGTSVSLAAIPGPDYLFSYWSGDASGSNPNTTVVMNDDRSVTANFSQLQPILQVSPTSLVFEATEGGSNPDNQTVSITNAGTGTLDWTATETMSWLSLSDYFGTAPSSVEMLVSVAGLVAGTYSGQVELYASGAQGSPQFVSVTLEIESPQTNCYTLTTSVVPANGGSVSVDTPPNCNGDQYEEGSAVSLTALPAPDYFFSYWSGDASGSNPDITVVMNSDKSVTANFSQQQPILEVNPTNLSFVATEGDSNPDAQTLSITNAGTGNLDWSAIESIPWLSLSATSGSAPAAVDVMIDIAGLGVGSYAGQIVVLGQDAQNSPQFVDVSLVVQEPPVEPIMTIDFNYLWIGGDAGSGVMSLYEDGTFADDSGHSGLWVYKPSQTRFYFVFVGDSCNAIWVGQSPDGQLITGPMLCRDGSNARGFWSGIIETALTDWSESERGWIGLLPAKTTVFD